MTTSLAARSRGFGDEAPVRGTVLHFGAPVTMRTVVSSQFERLRVAGWRPVICVAPDPHGVALAARADLEVVFGPMGHRPSVAEIVRGTVAFGALLASRRFDIVHTHNAHHGVVGRTLAGVVPRMGVIHTWRYSPLDAAGSAAQRRAFLLAEHVAGRLSDFVLFQNREDENEALSLGLVRPGQAVFIGNGIPIADLEPRLATTRKAARELHGLPQDAVLVGVVGRLQERKGQQFVLDSLPRVRAAVPGAQLLVVGDGPDRAELERLAVGLGVRESTHFLGFLEDPVGLLPALDVFVLPSRREGLPRALMEAMLAGLPVVATDVVGTRELVRDEVNGILVPYADPEAIAEAVVRVVLDPDLTSRLGTAARRTIARDHDEAVVVARIGALYDEVASAHASRRARREGRAW